jgi:hypothetical protein
MAEVLRMSIISTETDVTPGTTVTRHNYLDGTKNSIVFLLMATTPASKCVDDDLEPRGPGAPKKVFLPVLPRWKCPECSLLNSSGQVVCQCCSCTDPVINQSSMAGNSTTAGSSTQTFQ